MALYGSTIPLDGGGFVTTVICPNHYSHQRLMRALNDIVPVAGEPTPVAVAPIQDYGNPITPIALDDEEPPLRACPTGGCGLD
jgi:hypothetical protein